METISIVIPLFNKAPHIERALMSILKQTIQDFEIIIIDDGSTDSGWEMVAPYTESDNRIRLLRQDNQGVSAARNRGIGEASSDFIAFLDADDEWESDHLETLLRLRKAFPEAGICSTTFVNVNPDGSRTTTRFKGIPPAPWEGILPNYFKTCALSSTPVWSSAVGIPRHVFNKIGYFKVGERLGEDLDMWGRIALHYPVAFSWQGVAIYRLDATQRACELFPLSKELPFSASVRKHFGSERNAPYYVRYWLNQNKMWRFHWILKNENKYSAFKYLFSGALFPCNRNAFIKAIILLITPSFLQKIIKKSSR